MEEEKSASSRVIENWNGDFISSDRIMRFEEMVKENGESWTPTYLTVMEDYHNAQCPFCEATGAFKYHLFGKFICTQCSGEFKITIGDYIHRNLVKKMINTTIDAFGEGFIGGIFILIFMIPLKIILTIIGIPFVLIPRTKAPGKTVNNNESKEIDERSAVEYFLQISSDDKFKSAEEMIFEFISNINKDYLNDTFISEWASKYLEYCKLIGERIYSEAKNKSEMVLDEYLSLVDQDASWKDQSYFFERNGIDFKKIHIDTISDFSSKLFRAIV